MSAFSFMLVGGAVLFFLFLGLLVWSLCNGDTDSDQSEAERCLWEDLNAD